MPEISVLMSVYNGEPYLEAAIKSIREQSYKDFEFIIVNDGSTDHSLEIILQHAEQDKRIRVIDQANQGLIAALNTGLKNCETPLVARMDADDIALPERLYQQKDYMDKNPHIVALGSAILLIDEKSQTFGKSTYPSNGKALGEYLYKIGSPFAHPAVMMRKAPVMELGGYRKAYKHAEDYDLWLRLHKIGGLDNLKTPLLKYRQHNQKISVQNAHHQALVSVIARYAAQAPKDPTKDLESLSEEDLKRFDHDPDHTAWQILDITSSGLMIEPSLENLQDLERHYPSKISKKSKPFAAQTHLKHAYAYAKNRKYIDALRHGIKACVIAPDRVINIMCLKLSQKL